MVLANASFFHEKQHDKKNTDAHQHMQAMQTGHRIVETEEKNFPFPPR